MKQLNNLIIRACKHKNPQRRIRTLYRKFFSNSKPSHQTLTIILLGVIKEECPISTIKLIHSLHPDNWHDVRNLSYDYEMCLYYTLVNHIRLTSNKNLVGYIHSIRERKIKILENVN